MVPDLVKRLSNCLVFFYKPDCTEKLKFWNKKGFPWIEEEYMLYSKKNGQGTMMN